MEALEVGEFRGQIHRATIATRPQEPSRTLQIVALSATPPLPPFSADRVYGPTGRKPCASLRSTAKPHPSKSTAASVSGVLNAVRASSTRAAALDAPSAGTRNANESAEHAPVPVEMV